MTSLFNVRFTPIKANRIRLTIGAVFVAVLACTGGPLNVAVPPQDFIPVDTSRLMGTPDPLLPMQLVPAFPNLKFDKPLAFTYPPDGSHRVVVVTQNGVAYIFPNRPDVRQDEVRPFLDLRTTVSL